MTDSDPFHDPATPFDAQRGSALDDLPIQIWTARPDGHLDFANRRFLDFAGLELEELRGAGWRRLLHPDDVAVVLEHRRSSLARGEEFEVECQLRRNDGRYRWHLCRSTPQRDRSGRLVGWTGTSMDIHDHRMATQLRESEARLGLTLEAGRIGAWDLDLETRRATRSPIHDEIFGYAELVDEWSYEIFLQRHVHPDDRASVDQAFQRTLSTHQDWDFECRIVRADGSRGWIWARGSVYHDENGVPTRLLGLVKDITEQKEAERALLQARDDLERRVRERTAALESLNEELESFNYSVSHDLRAPLRAIEGFSRILRDDYRERLDDTGVHYLERIRAGALRMGELIDDLLDLSRLSRRPMGREPVDLSALAREVASSLRAVEPERRVEIVIQPGVRAEGDPKLLRIALENLLGNAWKFSRHQDEARIEFGRIDGDAEPVFFVRDNGAGFDMHYAGKLFTIFQRLHRAEEFAGMGIGLTTVQRIVRRHGGRIWGEGEVDRGAAFYFTLGDRSADPGSDSGPLTPRG